MYTFCSLWCKNTHIYAKIENPWKPSIWPQYRHKFSRKIDFLWIWNFSSWEHFVRRKFFQVSVCVCKHLLRTEIFLLSHPRTRVSTIYAKISEYNILTVYFGSFPCGYFYESISSENNFFKSRLVFANFLENWNFFCCRIWDLEFLPFPKQVDSFNMFTYFESFSLVLELHVRSQENFVLEVNVISQENFSIVWDLFANELMWDPAQHLVSLTENHIL